MGDPHNPNRIGEEWPQDRLDVQLDAIDMLKDLIILSGGWAWHFMSPPHKELKILHDHKDIDIFISPKLFDTLRSRLISNEYTRVKTRYDNPSGHFYRYTKFFDGGKIVFDTFVKDIEYIEVNGVKVVEPRALLALYGVEHTSAECVAVQAARKLVEQNISPVNREELILAP